LVTELSWRYIYLYETITGEMFEFPKGNVPIQERIKRNLKSV